MPENLRKFDLSSKINAVKELCEAKYIAVLKNVREKIKEIDQQGKRIY